MIYQSNSINTSHILVTVTLVGLSYISYKGILEDHANTIPSKGKGLSQSEALAGGASLDLLGLVVVVQFGSIFISTKLYWLLICIPIWGCYKLYTTFFGAKGAMSGIMGNADSTPATTEGVDTVVAEKSNEKRQKRAERRRQKWSS